MSDDIVVSVMITYYNQKQYIRDSLGSVLSQKTTFPVEIICGDDGSDDGTYEELLRWRDRYPGRIHIIRMQRENKREYEPIIRVSHNRLAMWHQARGRYVSFLDGDDYYSNTHKLQIQVELMEKHPECSGCCQPAMMLWENDPEGKKKVYGNCLIKSGHVIPAKEYWMTSLHHADTFLFRNLDEVKKEDINPLFFDDILISCYFVKHGDVIYSPDIMTVYRQVEGSSWNKRDGLHKAYWNMVVHSESGRILGKGWEYSCFCRDYATLKALYLARGKIDYSSEDKAIRDVLDRQVFIQRTKRYGTGGFLNKMAYQFRYCIPFHSRSIYWIYRWLLQRKYRSSKEKTGNTNHAFGKEEE